jgi:hypothetical protein
MYIRERKSVREQMLCHGSEETTAFGDSWITIKPSEHAKPERE